MPQQLGWNSRGGAFAKVAVYGKVYQLYLCKTSRSFVDWRYFLHCWRGGVNSNSQRKRKHKMMFFCLYRPSAIYARRPVIAKTAACYNAQHHSPPLLPQFQRECEQTTSNSISSRGNDIICKVRSHKTGQCQSRTFWRLSALKG